MVLTNPNKVSNIKNRAGIEDNDQIRMTKYNLATNGVFSWSFHDRPINPSLCDIFECGTTIVASILF